MAQGFGWWGLDGWMGLGLSEMMARMGEKATNLWGLGDGAVGNFLVEKAAGCS